MINSKKQTESVVLRHIAEKAGITRMAVSLALRGRSGVSEKTRAHVMEIAREMGYTPDPEISKLLSRIRSRVPPESRSCLALLTSGPSPGEWKKYVTEQRYVEGALARAREYGYRVEEFWMNKPGISPSRLTSILWNRGIEGIIIAPIQGKLNGKNARTIDLDFDQFSLVEISETVEWPNLDRSMHDQYTSMLKCLLELDKLGYARPGLVLDQALDMRVNGRWTAAFLRHRESRHVKLPLPLIIPRMDQVVFNRWLEKNEPDVIISVDHFGSTMLRKRGIRVPADMGYVSLDIEGDSEKEPGLSGIDQNSRMVGATAVDLLIGSIHRGQRGITTHPVRTAVEGTWVNGSTTRAQQSFIQDIHANPTSLAGKL